MKLFSSFALAALYLVPRQGLTLPSPLPSLPSGHDWMRFEPGDFGDSDGSSHNQQPSIPPTQHWPDGTSTFKPEDFQWTEAQSNIHPAQFSTSSYRQTNALGSHPYPSLLASSSNNALAPTHGYDALAIGNLGASVPSTPRSPPEDFSRLLEATMQELAHELGPSWRDQQHSSPEAFRDLSPDPLLISFASRIPNIKTWDQDRNPPDHRVKVGVSEAYKATVKERFFGNHIEWLPLPDGIETWTSKRLNTYLQPTKYVIPSSVQGDPPIRMGFHYVSRNNLIRPVIEGLNEQDTHSEVFGRRYFTAWTMPLHTNIGRSRSTGTSYLIGIGRILPGHGESLLEHIRGLVDHFQVPEGPFPLPRGLLGGIHYG